MTNKKHARELEAQAMVYPQGVVYDALMAGAAALDEVAALRAQVAKLGTHNAGLLCRQCAMAASFMAGGDGDGSVA